MSEPWKKCVVALHNAAVSQPAPSFGYGLQEAGRVFQGAGSSPGSFACRPSLGGKVICEPY